MTVATTTTIHRLVDMNSIGARDIAVGQTWIPVIAEAWQRTPWNVIERDVDHVIVEHHDRCDRQRVSFGALLATWALIEIVIDLDV